MPSAAGWLCPIPASGALSPVRSFSLCLQRRRISTSAQESHPLNSITPPTTILNDVRTPSAGSAFLDLHCLFAYDADQQIHQRAFIVIRMMWAHLRPPISTSRRLLKMDRRLAIADTVRFNFRAIESLSVFESSSASASSAGLWGALLSSFRPHLQPELDQAADGLGAIKFHALTRDPLVNCLQFIFGPLRIWASRKNPFCHPLCDPDRRGDFGQGGFLHVIFAFLAGLRSGFFSGTFRAVSVDSQEFPSPCVNCDI